MKNYLSSHRSRFHSFLTNPLPVLTIITLLVICLGIAPSQHVQADLDDPDAAYSLQALSEPEDITSIHTHHGIPDEMRVPFLQPVTQPNAPPVSPWSALPNQGFNTDVFALAVSGSDIYVGGKFTQTSDGTLTDLGYIARYDTISGAWNALPNKGLSGNVYALLASGTDLYVGGFFSQTGDGTLTNLGSIARYDTVADTWHALGNQGLNSTVSAFAISGDDLYVGGMFTQTGDGSLTELGHIARYDTAVGSWAALSNQGLNARVRAINVSGDNLFVGGDFNWTGDTTLNNLGHIARYITSTDTWLPLPDEGLDGSVYALAVYDSDLYVGGEFNEAGDGYPDNLGNIVRYDTMGSGTWNQLPYRLNGRVHTMLLSGNDLYIAGVFTQYYSAPLQRSLGRVVRYEITGGDWYPLSYKGLGDTVRTIAVYGGEVFFGGDFTQTGDGIVTDLGCVARYDPSVITWEALSNSGLNEVVTALWKYGDDLYVGGDFTQTGDGTVLGLGYIARYDTLTENWFPLVHQGLNSLVWAFAQVGDDLYVGGDFTQSYDSTVNDLNYIARYDTTAGTWYPLSNQGLNGFVYTMAVNGSDLYVGGLFTQTMDGGVTGLNHIARYDSGSGTWSALADLGLDGAVRALLVSDDNLFVGGEFIQTAGGEQPIQLGKIARYEIDSNTWYAFPSKGLDNTVRALAEVGDMLYVGGAFINTGNAKTNLNYIARYDAIAGTWYSFPHQGLQDDVLSFVVSGNDLFIGGHFEQTGDGMKSLNHIARFDTTRGGSWWAMPNNGLGDPVAAIGISGSHLYAGGFHINNTGDSTVKHLGNIARCALAVPEIQVLDGTTNIPDGTGVVDFGTTGVGVPVDKTITVQNTGTGDLTLAEPIIYPPGFSIASSFAATTLAPGRSTTFVLRLDAASSGTYSGSIEFTNNDEDENPFNFTVYGVVDTPHLSLSAPNAEIVI